MATTGEPGDDAGSMPIVMLLAMVGMSLSAVLASMTANHIVVTRRAAQLPRALDAAQAGLDVAMARISTAVDASGAGDRTLLPCGPYNNGAVGGSRASTYQVTIVYRTPGGTAINCSGAGAASTPGTADLVSIGTDTSSGVSRTVSATYQFRTTNQNIPGGLIRIFPTAADLCLDAGSSAPTTGTALRTSTCRPGSPQQTFVYGDQLYLYLKSSVTDADPLGMCVDAGAVPHTTNGVAVTFQPCQAVVAAREQWSFNDHANFEGTSDGVVTDNFCLSIPTPGVPSPIVLNFNNAGGNAYCKGVSDPGHTMAPAASVGAGAAAKAGSPQVINFAQFGRCMDVTNKDVNIGYVEVYPCKQAPDPSKVSWNQQWVVPTLATGQASTTGQIKTVKNTNPTGTYCLSSPLTTAAGAYPVPATCPAGTPVDGAATTWTINGDTGTYSTSYTMVDGVGNCLAATDPDVPNPDLNVGGSQSFSKVIVAPCTGSTLQKWDAPPNVLYPTPLRDLHEK